MTHPFRSKRKNETERDVPVYQRRITPPINSIPFPIFLDPRLHNLLYQCIWQRLIGREVNGPLGTPEAPQFHLEPVEYARPRWEQTAMVLKRRVPDQHSSVLEHRNPVADHLGGLSRHHRPNHATNVL